MSTATYTKEQFRQLFRSKFDAGVWTDLLINFFGAQKVRRTPEPLDIAPEEQAQGYYWGKISTSDNYEISLFYVHTDRPIVRRKVGLRQLVAKYINIASDAGLAVFDDGNHWRLSFITDLRSEKTPTRRFTYVFGDAREYYNTPVSRFLKLQSAGVSFASLREAFSVEALSKEFYADLYNWYQWALSDEIHVTFPNNPEDVSDDRENMNIKIIRLITRLLFVWFVKQKGLVPDSLFCEDKLSSILRDFDPQSTTSGNYYNAILQNLFFATLNCAIRDEEGLPRRFADACSRRDTRNLYRYAEMFSIPESEVVSLFSQVPFLNGGLFECLDKPKGLYEDLDHDILFDGFSRNDARAAGGNLKYRAFVPNALFFSHDEQQPGLIPLLNRYNFTIEENSATDAVVSLDPELLGRVFENLLAAYNPETQESARKSTGSFYTPRVIVDFMVDEALKSYLLPKIADESSKTQLYEAKKLLSELFSNGSASGLSAEKRAAIVSALENVKILDPACGSGAFPMGCLLRIVDVIEALSPTPVDRYGLKLKIIEHCIYGIDIQPIAMMICKLRFFISLICEQRDVDFGSPETNFGINTLPNLETKFVAADSLISAEIRKYNGDWTQDKTLVALKNELLDIRNANLLAKGRRAKRQSQRDDKQKRQEIKEYIKANAQKPNEEKIQLWESELQRLSTEAGKYAQPLWVDELQPEQHDLFGVVENGGGKLFRKDANKKRRDEISAKISYIERSIAQERAKAETTGFEAAVEQITQWNPYDQNSVSPYFDAEWMFGVSDGFDIVIGNPPYIQLQNDRGRLAKLYEPCRFHSFASTGDIYCLFYERGANLLKPSGTLCFITSNKWMRAGYGEKLRGYLAANTDPRKLIDFAGVKIFEAATVDTNILLFRVGCENSQATECVVANKRDAESMLNNLSLYVEQHRNLNAFASADSWVVLSPIEQSIKRKIEAVGTPLKDWDINIYRGVLTGYNDAFIIGESKRQEILANCQSLEERKRTDELIRPILRGRDIRRYGYDWKHLYIINTHNGVKGKFPRIDINDYPAIKAHLDQYWDKIKDRADQGDTPYNLRNCAYMEDFSRPKIVFQEIVQESAFCYDQNKRFLCNDTCRIITGDKIEFLLGILNSKLFSYAVRKFYGGGLLGDGGIRMKHTFFGKFPCIKPNQQIEILALEQSDRFLVERQEELDKNIYNLYRLDDEEIMLIESQ